MAYHVLFIRNSHTYKENLPWVFAEVCRQAGIDVRVTMLAHPGVDWSWHLLSCCALPNIRFGGYDYVVIQQKSHPFDGAQPLMEQGLALFRAISDAKSTAVLMSTWSEKNNPEGQEEIDSAFAALHSACRGSLLARCGSAWHKLRGKLDLYSGDGEHQNSKGAYLNACVLAKTMFGINSSRLPPEIKTKALTAELTTDELRLLQKTAADT
ncbi:MAG: hypothetical protein GX254_01085 [Clostridiales bacterium]|jgi:hypothetical protein|nr:hypothetical protein [Clostridiales bacterium]